MKNIVLILAIGLLLFSCSKNDDFTTEESAIEMRTDADLLNDRIKDFQSEQQFHSAISANGSPTGYTFNYSSNQNMHTSNPIDSVTTVNENDKNILPQKE